MYTCLYVYIIKYDWVTYFYIMLHPAYIIYDAIKCRCYVSLQIRMNNKLNTKREFGQKKHEIYTNRQKKSVLEYGQKNIVLLLTFLVY